MAQGNGLAKHIPQNVPAVLLVCGMPISGALQLLAHGENEELTARWLKVGSGKHVANC